MEQGYQQQHTSTSIAQHSSNNYTNSRSAITRSPSKGQSEIINTQAEN